MEDGEIKNKIKWNIALPNMQKAAFQESIERVAL